MSVWISSLVWALCAFHVDGFVVQQPRSINDMPSTFVLYESSSPSADDTDSAPKEDSTDSDIVLESPVVVNGAEDSMMRLEPKIEEEDDRTESKSVAPESLVKQLLELGARTNRGETAKKSAKEAADDLISSLEAANPTQQPVLQGDKIKGRWELVYSSTQLFRSSPFFMAGRAVCESEDQAAQYDWFCDMHRAALAISQIGAVRQIISENRIVSEFETTVGSVPFISDFTPFSYSGGLPVTIDGAIVSSADITATADGKAWEIFMDTVEIKGSNIPGLRQVLDNGLKLESRQLGGFLEANVPSYTNPKPTFGTTYLDDSFRISRDQDGKAFVYVKTSDSTDMTNYAGATPDLGIARLLEGFNDAITKFYI